MPGKDIGFVHIDEETCEDVIDQMENCPFNGGKMKISYGQIGPGLLFYGKIFISYYVNLAKGPGLGTIKMLVLSRFMLAASPKWLPKPE